MPEKNNRSMKSMDTMDTLESPLARETSGEFPSLTQRKRGFAALTAERRREIARKGGKTAQARGVAHRFTIEEAREAGRKGGRSISRDRLHMSAIGHKGGSQSGKRGQAALD
jgi:hypothetical protein